MKTNHTTKDKVIQAALLRGMLSGLEGRRNIDEPEGWLDSQVLDLLKFLQSTIQVVLPE